ncbi:hypothetical protein [Streptomyces sp. XY413]|uniref:hypothetical protein n=1 Tax=Streptomyces sp. XY413 TaxID=1519479 RepID=UPI00131E7E4D|nr:hypothetical protein [Streptomyces sp. XY413]
MDRSQAPSDDGRPYAVPIPRPALTRPTTPQKDFFLLTSWAPLEAGGPVTTASCRRPKHLHHRFDRSHAYAILASPGDRTS